MSSPQIKNGFTKIANELFEAYIKIGRFLSPYENIVWLCILRKTYGYHQKEDWISLSQVEVMTNILQPHIARTKKKLLLKNMIEKRNGGIGIQKDYELWNIPKQVSLKYTQTGINIPKQVLPKQVRKLTQTGNLDLHKQVDTKDTITKDTIYIYPAFEKAVFEGWNSFCDSYPILAKLNEVTDERRLKLKKRYEKKSFQEFNEILKAITEQPFLLGDSEKGWKVSFDWLIKNNTNYIKVLERRYKDTQPKVRKV